jgi:hypothetical protein
MLRAVTAHQFVKRMGSGKTIPCLLRCSEITILDNEDEDEESEASDDVELIVKFSQGCEAKK